MTRNLFACDEFNLYFVFQGHQDHSTVKLSGFINIPVHIGCTLIISLSTIFSSLLTNVGTTLFFNLSHPRKVFIALTLIWSMTLILCIFYFKITFMPLSSQEINTVSWNWAPDSQPMLAQRRARLAPSQLACHYWPNTVPTTCSPAGVFQAISPVPFDA